MRLTDLLLYFGQFVGRSAVLELLNGKTDSQLPDYSELLERINTLSESGVDPLLKNFVMGTDEASISQRISTFSNLYQFLDYGSNNLKFDNTGRCTTTAEIALTVALPVSAMGDVNQAELLLISEQTKDLVLRINEILRKDRYDIYWLKNYADVSIIPFFAPTLSISHGWTLTFSITY